MQVLIFANVRCAPTGAIVVMLKCNRGVYAGWCAMTCWPDYLPAATGTLRSISRPFDRSALSMSNDNWRRIQYPWLVPKYRLRRKSYSGVHRRLPFFIAERCGRGMPVAFATSVIVAGHSSNVSWSVTAKKFSSGIRLDVFMGFSGNLRFWLRGHWCLPTGRQDAIAG